MIVRYAVVGAGWISQIAFMPGVDLTGNSKMTAIVTGNPSQVSAMRFSDADILALNTLAWWNWPVSHIESARPALLAGSVERLKAFAP